ncbi:MAG: hypothetical protein R2695_09320 [Acidimicrobiales bacterium]
MLSDVLPTFPHPRRWLGVTIVAFALVVAGCGGDDGDSSSGGSVESNTTAGETDGSSDQPDTTTGDEGENAFSVGDDSDLIVPLDYLQGEWCNSDGEAWVVEGETARFGASHDELSGEVPVSVAFVDSPETNFDLAV